MPELYKIDPVSATLSSRDGQHELNRWMHRGGVVLITGDRPRFRVSKLQSRPHQMTSDLRLLATGRLRLQEEEGWTASRQSVWFDELVGRTTEFEPHATCWRASWNGFDVELCIGQAAGWGAVLRLTAHRTQSKAGAVQIALVLSELGGGTDGATQSGEGIARGDHQAVITAGDGLETFVRGGPELRLTKHAGEIWAEWTPRLAEGETAVAWLVLGCRDGRQPDWPWSPAECSPAQLLAASASYYSDLLQSSFCRTPSRALDAALATAVTNLEYVYAPPAWLEGIQYWSAYWCNNYQIQAALLLGQTGRARDALVFFGGRERGPCPVLCAAGEPTAKWDGANKSISDDEDGLPYWLLQFCRYVEHTGDLALADRLWPQIERAITYCWEARDQRGNGLLSWHMGCNTFMYQADALGMPGEAASPSLMMAGMLERLAPIAERLGRRERAEAWRERTQAMYRALKERLWLSGEGCFCNHRDLQDRITRAHYYTDLVFPALYTRLPDTIAWQSLLHAVQELWIPLDTERGLLRVGNFKPDGFGNNNPMPTQMAEAARAFFRAGLRARGMALLETVARAATTETDAPGNYPEKIGTDGCGLPHYVFGNPIGSFVIAVVEGLFGLTLAEEGQTLDWQPAFPDEWDRAHLRLSYAEVTFDRHRTGGENVAVYRLCQKTARSLRFAAILPPGRISAVTLNDTPVPFSIEARLGSTRVTVAASAAGEHVLTVTYVPCPVSVQGPSQTGLGQSLCWVCEPEAERIEDPQAVLEDVEMTGSTVRARTRLAGLHTVFIHHRGVSAVTPVCLSVVPQAEVSQPAAAQAAAMLGRPIEVLDPAPWRNSDRILWMIFWGDNGVYTIDRKALAGEEGVLHTPAGDFPLPAQGPLLGEIVYGMSEKHSRALRRSDRPHRLRIPIERPCAGLWLLYLCDVEVRHTDCEVGAIELESTGGRVHRLPLTMGIHIDTALPQVPGTGIPDRRYAAAALPVPLAVGGHANLLWIAPPVPDLIHGCTITMDVADAWFGLLGVAAVQS